MNKVCFLIPVYPPHFSYLDNFIESFKKYNYDNQADICVVFTNEEESLSYKNKDINRLILPPQYRVFKNKGIINIKKLWALFILKESQYDYILVLDAEALIVKHINLINIFNKFYNEKILWGNQVTSGGATRVNKIKNSCKRFFMYKDKLDSNLYLWFNQPCIYKVSILPDFLKKINFESNIKNLTWNDFDYYIYMYYLILYQDFKVKDLELVSNYGICESCVELIRFNSNIYKSANIKMCSKNLFELFDNEDLFLVIHLDRDFLWTYNLLLMRLNNLEKKQNKNKIKFKLFRRLLSLFVPDKRLRRRIRGDE